ncbi:MAG TPA: SPFH domain-containing protein [Cyclobacteriaceae bacterium]|nr:SPFH domain-containing protein [Cyclobacteriaceae bacterium]
MTFVIHKVNGTVKREGRGLNFFYFAPVSNIIAIPLGSRDIQFIFNETTRDFQNITTQGQITYVVDNPKALAEYFDFTVSQAKNLQGENFQKLNQRLNNEAQMATSAFIQSLSLKDALRSAKEISERIKNGLQTSEAIKILGVEILSVDVLAVKPSPEMAKALETETRELLQKDADEAIYSRRNFAVEQERKIKESQLNTEIAVQEKQKQINEKQWDIKVIDAEKARKLREMKMEADLAVEEQKTKLTELQAENDKRIADAKGYMLEKTLAPYKTLDWKTLMAIQPGSLTAIDNIGFAFRELAENAGKIGTLNITPDLLESVIKQQKTK